MPEEIDEDLPVIDRVDEVPAADIRVRVDAPCGTVILQRPAKRNALRRQTLLEISQAMADLHQQANVRAVVITGSSDTFSAGTDLQELRDTAGEDDQAQWFEDANNLRKLIVQFLMFPKPIIAAVNGPALGSGLSLVTACDIVLASSAATFGVPETRRGLSAGMNVPLLSFRIGASQAGNLLMQSGTIGAEEARRIGIVHELVEHDLLWARGNELARQMTTSCPHALAMSKRLLNETVGERLLTELSSAAAAIATARTTESAREGIAAFLEKRPPQWS